jgi:hypothetical protein
MLLSSFRKKNWQQRTRAVLLRRAVGSSRIKYFHSIQVLEVYYAKMIRISVLLN